MPNKPQLKGYAFALLATIAGSTVYIFSKAAFNQISLAQFGIYWFAMAIVWNTLFTLRSAEHRQFHVLTPKTIKILILIGFIEIIATGTFYAAISVSENPAIPSFLRNMEYIFVTLMGVILLKERFTFIEVLGILLTLIGVLVISYHKDVSVESYFKSSTGLMLISTIFYGVRTITVKLHIQKITPTILAISRAIFLLLAALVMLQILGQDLVIPQKALINITIGSFLGPFLTSLSQYNALKYLEASRSSIIQSTTALFVLIGAYLFFGRFPMGYQLIGGAIAIAGPMILIMGKKIDFGRKHTQKQINQ